jgi:biotin carboxyl carrier protein
MDQKNESVHARCFFRNGEVLNLNIIGKEVKEFTVTIDGNQFTITYDSDRKLFVDKKAVETTIKKIDEEIFQLTFEQKVYNIWIERIDETHYNTWIDHHIFKTSVEDKQNGVLKSISNTSAATVKSSVIRAPMPGLISKIEVNIGDIVSPGTGLIVLEAMKMENEIHSTLHGKIKSIEIKNHVTVEKDQILIVIEPTN